MIQVHGPKKKCVTKRSGQSKILQTWQKFCKYIFSPAGEMSLRPVEQNLSPKPLTVFFQFCAQGKSHSRADSSNPQ